MCNKSLLAMICVGSLSVVSQSRADDTAALISDLKSDSRETRQRGFYKVYNLCMHSTTQGTHLSPALESAVVGLLWLETKEGSKTTSDNVSDDSEADSDYFFDMIEVVSRIGTLAASQALLDSAVVTTGNMATDGVARSGHAIVNLVLAKFDAAPEGGDGSEANYYKSSLIQVMSKLVSKTESITPADHAALETRLLAASQSGAYFSRVFAIDGLLGLNDKVATARLTEMRDRDPYNLPIKGKIVFPVRDDAAKALRKIGQ